MPPSPSISWLGKIPCKLIGAVFVFYSSTEDRTHDDPAHQVPGQGISRGLEGYNMLKRVILSAVMVFATWSVATASHAGLSINLPGFGLHLPLPGVGISIGLPVVAAPAYPAYYEQSRYVSPAYVVPGGGSYYIQGQFYGDGYGSRNYHHRYYRPEMPRHRYHDQGRYYGGHGGGHYRGR
jgi:hypothetical protein